MGANDILTLTRGSLSLDLYSWLHGSLHQGHEALMGIEGFGLPPQTNRWFEGAGDGATYRGSRVQPRTLMIPLSSQSPSRAGLDKLLSDIAKVLAPINDEQAQLRFRGSDGKTWFLRVVREDGGDYVRAPKQFDKNRYFRTTLGLKAGDPFWTREEAQNITLRQDDSGRGLMPYLARLEVSSGQVFGDFVPNAPGDAPAWPVWTIGGPLTSFTLTGPNGGVLRWDGNMVQGERRIVNTRQGTIVDELGINRYNELAPAPTFWPIPAGGNKPIRIETEGAGGPSFITAEWQPRKWSMI